MPCIVAQDNPVSDEGSAGPVRLVVGTTLPMQPPVPCRSLTADIESAAKCFATNRSFSQVGFVVQFFGDFARSAEFSCCSFIGNSHVNNEVPNRAGNHCLQRLKKRLPQLLTTAHPTNLGPMARSACAGHTSFARSERSMQPKGWRAAGSHAIAWGSEGKRGSKHSTQFPIFNV